MLHVLKVGRNLQILWSDIHTLSYYNIQTLKVCVTIEHHQLFFSEIWYAADTVCRKGGKRQNAVYQYWGKSAHKSQ